MFSSRQPLAGSLSHSQLSAHSWTTLQLSNRCSSPCISSHCTGSCMDSQDFERVTSESHACGPSGN